MTDDEQSDVDQADDELSDEVTVIPVPSGNLVLVDGPATPGHSLALAAAGAAVPPDDANLVYLVGETPRSAAAHRLLAGQPTPDRLVLVPWNLTDGPDATRLASDISPAEQFVDEFGMQVQVPPTAARSPRTVPVDAHGRETSPESAATVRVLPRLHLAARNAVRAALSLSTDENGATSPWSRLMRLLDRVADLPDSVPVPDAAYALAVYLAWFGLPAGLDRNALSTTVMPPTETSVLAAIGGTATTVDPDALVDQLRRHPGSGALVVARPGDAGPGSFAWLLAVEGDSGDLWWAGAGESPVPYDAAPALTTLLRNSGTRAMLVDPRGRPTPLVADPEPPRRASAVLPRYALHEPGSRRGYRSHGIGRASVRVDSELAASLLASLRRALRASGFLAPDPETAGTGRAAHRLWGNRAAERQRHNWDLLRAILSEAELGRRYDDILQGAFAFTLERHGIVDRYVEIRIRADQLLRDNVDGQSGDREAGMLRLPITYRAELTYGTRAPWTSEPVTGYVQARPLSLANAGATIPSSRPTPPSVLDRAYVYHLDTSGVLDAVRRQMPAAGRPGSALAEAVTTYASPSSLADNIGTVARGGYSTARTLASRMLPGRGPVFLAGGLGTSEFLGVTEDLDALRPLRRRLAARAERDPGTPDAAADVHRAYAFSTLIDLEARRHSRRHPARSRPVGRDVPTARTLVYLLSEPDALRAYSDGELPMSAAQLTDAMHRWSIGADPAGDGWSRAESTGDHLDLPANVVALVLARWQSESSGHTGDTPTATGLRQSWATQLAGLHNVGTVQLTETAWSRLAAAFVLAAPDTPPVIEPSGGDEPASMPLEPAQSPRPSTTFPVATVRHIGDLIRLSRAAANVRIEIQTTPGFVPRGPMWRGLLDRPNVMFVEPTATTGTGAPGVYRYTVDASGRVLHGFRGVPEGRARLNRRGAPFGRRAVRDAADLARLARRRPVEVQLPIGMRLPEAVGSRALPVASGPARRGGFAVLRLAPRSGDQPALFRYLLDGDGRVLGAWRMVPWPPDTPRWRYPTEFAPNPRLVGQAVSPEAWQRTVDWLIALAVDGIPVIEEPVRAQLDLLTGNERHLLEAGWAVLQRRITTAWQWATSDEPAAVYTAARTSPSAARAVAGQLAGGLHSDIAAYLRELGEALARERPGGIPLRHGVLGGSEKGKAAEALGPEEATRPPRASEQWWDERPAPRPRRPAPDGEWTRNPDGGYRVRAGLRPRVLPAELTRGTVAGHDGPGLFSLDPEPSWSESDAWSLSGSRSTISLPSSLDAMSFRSSSFGPTGDDPFGTTLLHSLATVLAAYGHPVGARALRDFLAQGGPDDEWARSAVLDEMAFALTEVAASEHGTAPPNDGVATDVGRLLDVVGRLLTHLANRTGVRIQLFVTNEHGSTASVHSEPVRGESGVLVYLHLDYATLEVAPLWPVGVAEPAPTLTDSVVARPVSAGGWVSDGDGVYDLLPGAEPARRLPADLFGAHGRTSVDQAAPRRAPADPYHGQLLRDTLLVLEAADGIPARTPTRGFPDMPRLRAFAQSSLASFDAGMSLPEGLHELITDAAASLTGARVPFRLQVFQAHDGEVRTFPVQGEEGGIFHVFVDEDREATLLWSQEHAELSAILATLARHGRPELDTSVRARMKLLSGTRRDQLAGTWDYLSTRIVRALRSYVASRGVALTRTPLWRRRMFQELTELRTQVQWFDAELDSAVVDANLRTWFGFAENELSERHRELWTLLQGMAGNQDFGAWLVETVDSTGVRRQPPARAQWRREVRRLLPRARVRGLPVWARQRLFHAVGLIEEILPGRLAGAVRAQREALLRAVARVGEAVRTDPVWGPPHRQQDQVRIGTLTSIVRGWRVAAAGSGPVGSAPSGAADPVTTADLRALVDLAVDFAADRAVTLEQLRTAFLGSRTASASKRPERSGPDQRLSLPDDGVRLPEHLARDQMLGPARANPVPGTESVLLGLVHDAVGPGLRADDPGLLELSNDLKHRFRDLMAPERTDGAPGGKPYVVWRAGVPVEMTVAAQLVNTAHPYDVAGRGSRRLDAGTQSVRKRTYIRRFVRSRLIDVPFSTMFGALVGPFVGFDLSFTRDEPTFSLSGGAAVLNQKITRSGTGTATYLTDVRWTVTTLETPADSALVLRGEPRRALGRRAVVLELPEYLIRPSAYTVPADADQPPVELDLNGQIPRTYAIEDVGDTAALFAALAEDVPSASVVATSARRGLQDMAARRHVANYLDLFLETYRYTPVLLDRRERQALAVKRVSARLGRARRLSVTVDGDVVMRHSLAYMIEMGAAVDIGDSIGFSAGVGPGVRGETPLLGAVGGLRWLFGVIAKRVRGSHTGGVVAARQLADATGPTGLYAVDVTLTVEPAGGGSPTTVEVVGLLRIQNEEAVRLALGGGARGVGDGPGGFRYDGTSVAPVRTGVTPGSGVQPPAYLAGAHPTTIGSSIVADVTGGWLLHDRVVTALELQLPELFPGWQRLDPSAFGRRAARLVEIVDNYRTVAEGVGRTPLRAGANSLTTRGFRFRFRRVGPLHSDRYLLTVRATMSNRRHAGTTTKIRPADIAMLRETVRSTHARTRDLFTGPEFFVAAKSLAYQISGRFRVMANYRHASGRAGHYGTPMTIYRLSYLLTGVEAFVYDLDFAATLEHFRRPSRWRRQALTTVPNRGWRWRVSPPQELLTGDHAARGTLTLWTPSDISWRPNPAPHPLEPEQPDNESEKPHSKPEKPGGEAGPGSRTGPLAPSLAGSSDSGPARTRAVTYPIVVDDARRVLLAPRQLELTRAFHLDGLDNPSSELIRLASDTLAEATNGAGSVTTPGAPVEQAVADRLDPISSKAHITTLTAPGGMPVGGLVGDGSFVDRFAGVLVRATATNWRVENVVRQMVVEEYHHGTVDVGSGRSEGHHLGGTVSFGAGETPQDAIGRFASRQVIDASGGREDTTALGTHVIGAHERNRSHIGFYLVLKADVTYTALATARVANRITEVLPRWWRPGVRAAARQLVVADGLYVYIAGTDLRDLGFLDYEYLLPPVHDLAWVAPEPMRRGLGLGVSLLDNKLDLDEFVQRIRRWLDAALVRALPQELAEDLMGGLQHLLVGLRADGVHSFVDNLLDGGVPLLLRRRTIGTRRVVRALIQLRQHGEPVFEDLHADADIENYHIGYLGHVDIAAKASGFGVAGALFAGDDEPHHHAQGLLPGLTIGGGHASGYARVGGREQHIQFMLTATGPAARFVVTVVPEVVLEYRDGSRTTISDVRPELDGTWPTGRSTGQSTGGGYVPLAQMLVRVPESMSSPGPVAPLPGVGGLGEPRITHLPSELARPHQLARWRREPGSLRLPRQFAPEHMWGAGSVRLAAQRLLSMLAAGTWPAPGSDLAAMDRLNVEYRVAGADQSTALWTLISNITLLGTLFEANDAQDRDPDGQLPDVDGARTGLALPTFSVRTAIGLWQDVDVRVLANLRHVRLHSVAAQEGENFRIEQRRITTRPEEQRHFSDSHYGTAGTFQVSLDQPHSGVPNPESALLNETDLFAVGLFGALDSGAHEEQRIIAGTGDSYDTYRDIAPTYEFRADVVYRLWADMDGSVAMVEVVVPDGLYFRLREPEALDLGLVTPALVEELSEPVAEVGRAAQEYKNAAREERTAQSLLADALRTFADNRRSEAGAFDDVELAHGIWLWNASRTDSAQARAALEDSRRVQRSMARWHWIFGRTADVISRHEAAHEVLRRAAVRDVAQLRAAQARRSGGTPGGSAPSGQEYAALSQAARASREAWQQAWEQMGTYYRESAAVLSTLAGEVREFVTSLRGRIPLDPERLLYHRVRAWADVLDATRDSAVRAGRSWDEVERDRAGTAATVVRLHDSRAVLKQVVAARVEGNVWAAGPPRRPVDDSGLPERGIRDTEYGRSGVDLADTGVAVPGGRYWAAEPGAPPPDSLPYVPGVFVVAVHGAAGGLRINGRTVSAARFGGIVGNTPGWQGQPILLLWCDTEPVRGPAAVPSVLRQLLRVDVYASDGWLESTPVRLRALHVGFDRDGGVRPRYELARLWRYPAGGGDRVDLGHEVPVTSLGQLSADTVVALARGGSIQELAAFAGPAASHAGVLRLGSVFLTAVYEIMSDGWPAQATWDRLRDERAKLADPLKVNLVLALHERSRQHANRQPALATLAARLLKCG